jgi:hypothetical protein
MGDKELPEDLFAKVCRALGHDPGTVISVRMNPREVAVTFVDADDALRTSARDLERGGS